MCVNSWVNSNVKPRGPGSVIKKEVTHLLRHAVCVCVLLSQQAWLALRWC